MIFRFSSNSKFYTLKIRALIWEHGQALVCAICTMKIKPVSVTLARDHQDNHEAASSCPDSLHNLSAQTQAHKWMYGSVMGREEGEEGGRQNQGFSIQ